MVTAFLILLFVPLTVMAVDALQSVEYVNRNHFVYVDYTRVALRMVVVWFVTFFGMIAAISAYLRIQEYLL